MKSIIFIIPYFGKLPNYFKLWLESCRYNPTIDFLLFIDDKTCFDFPPNVKINYTTFDEIKMMIQSNYDFKIVLPRPYKLCDFRPAYGEIFEDYIKNYDYWGYCDIDLIWGDIRKFVTDEILTKYKRLFTHGHCTIMENSKDVNAYYRELPTFDILNYKSEFQTPLSKCFDERNIDEIGGTVNIFIKNNIPMYDETTMFDINFSKGNFISYLRNDNGKNQYYKYCNGKLYQISSNGNIEGMYVHFQKRNLKIDDSLNYNKYFLIAPYYVSSDSNKFKKYFIKKKLFEFNFFKNKIISHFKREKLRNKVERGKYHV